VLVEQRDGMAFCAKVACLAPTLRPFRGFLFLAALRVIVSDCDGTFSSAFFGPRATELQFKKIKLARFRVLQFSFCCPFNFDPEEVSSKEADGDNKR